MVAAFLREVRGEIVETTLARLQDLASAAGARDPVYEEGQAAAVEAGVQYAIDLICDAESRNTIPPILIDRARQAARRSIPLEELLRNYLSAFSLLTEFIFKTKMRTTTLRELVRLLVLRLDEALQDIADEYTAELERSSGLIREHQTVDRIRAILAGQPVDQDALDYRLSAHHVGAVAVGEGAEKLIREASAPLGLRVLVAYPAVDVLWAWLGAESLPSLETFLQTAGEPTPSATPSVVLGFGEPARGISGFRRTHREASAALRVAHRDRRPTRYSNVALLASILQDELLSASLRKRYVEPLEDDGENLQILRAFFSAGRNYSAAAASLGRNRRTVKNRLAAVERRLGQPLTRAAPELEAAVMLWGLPALNV